MEVAERGGDELAMLEETVLLEAILPLSVIGAEDTVEGGGREVAAAYE